MHRLGLLPRLTEPLLFGREESAVDYYWHYALSVALDDDTAAVDTCIHTRTHAHMLT